MIKTNEHKGAISWMLHHHVTANILMAVLLIGGIVWTFLIKKEVFPEFDLDSVRITVPYPGASPEEVEKGVILAVEEAVEGLDGIKSVSSTASEGAGNIIVEMIAGENLQQLARDVQSEVDRITSFPEEAEEPKVSIITRKRQVLSLAVFGDVSERVLREIVEQIRDQFLQSDGITQVELAGVRPFEIRVEIAQEKLRKYGLTVSQIASVLRRSSVELPGGGVKTKGGEILLRVTERREYGKEFATIPIITTQDGTRVLLGDIAEITDGFRDEDTYATYNGKRAMMVDVFRVGDETPISVADAARNKMEELRKSLPQGIGIEVVDDWSDIYRQRVQLLLKNGSIGLLLVMCLLGIFLELRLAFWVMMGIPISFLGGIMFLPALSVSINMISLFAFIIALGIVVDDAIVVGENIYRYRQDGVPFMEAAILGTKEVTVPVIFSVLTNIVAFLPLAFVEGRMGKFMWAIPAVVVTVFAISLFECLFILPAHVGHQKDQVHGGTLGALHRLQQRFSDWFKRIIAKLYGPTLNLLLHNRYIMTAIAISILIITLTLVKAGHIRVVFMPRVESDISVVTAVLPYGSPIEKVRELEQNLIHAAEKVRDDHDNLVKGIFSVINNNQVEARMFLTSPEVRPIPTSEATQKWRKLAGNFAGIENLSFRADAGGPGGGKAMALELSHRDLHVLEKAGEYLASELQNFPQVKDVDDGFQTGKQQLDFTIRPEGRALGLTARDVANQVRNYLYGAEVLRQQRGRNEVRVMVRLKEEDRSSEYNIEEMVLLTPAGKEIMLREAVDITRGTSYTKIEREDGRRVITVTADVVPQEETDAIMVNLQKDTFPALRKNHPGLAISLSGRQEDRKESMASLARGLLMAILLVYVLLAIPFNSYTQPLIIMISIPFGIIGAVLGHVIMGYSLSLISFFGVVALSGVVVNDSLILIDFANREHLKGKSRKQAVLHAGIARFRPIMLTTLTTFLGLAPMIWETSRQAKFLIPMAISLGFGILFATFITLGLVPCLYLIIDDFKKAWGPTAIPKEIETTLETTS